MKTPAIPRPWPAALILANAPTTGAAGTPEPPANPLAHAIIPDSDVPRIRVSWDHSQNATAYTVSRSDGQSFDTGGPSTTYSDTAVNPGIAHSYSVAAKNGNGTSSPSDPASARVPDAPSAPGNLAGEIAEIQVTDTSPSVTLSWNPSTVPEGGECETSYPLAGYTVWRVQNEAETEIGTPEAGATSFIDDSAAFGTQYTYRVAARNAAGNSPATEVTVNVPVPPLPPATKLTASIADPFDGNVSLSWNAPTEGPAIAGYMVLRYHGTSDPYPGTDLPVTLAESATGTNLTDHTAQAGVTYSYVVLACSALNFSDPSNTAVIEPPAPVSDLTAEASDGTIELGWMAPTSGTAVEYRVERQQDGTWETLADTAETSHSDNTAVANVPYTYRVQHRNQYGGSAWTESQSVTIVTAPAKPTGLTAAVEGDDNVLSWTAPGSPIIDGYRVEHRQGGAQWNDLATGLTGTEYRHEGAEADVLYEYRVRAYNSAGNGPWSDVASARRITPPRTPGSVQATLDGADIVLTWERPDSVHVSGYTVRHAQGDGEYTFSDRLPESQTPYRISNAVGDIVHRLGVQAHNDAGDSPWSTDAEITRVLPPGVPTNVQATADDLKSPSRGPPRKPAPSAGTTSSTGPKTPPTGRPPTWQRTPNPSSTPTTARASLTSTESGPTTVPATAHGPTLPPPGDT